MAAWSLSACGGAFHSAPDDGSEAGSGGGGAAGASGRGGSSSGGRAGSGSGGSSAGSCVFEGTTYADGDSFPAGDGCNHCTCEDGAVGCTLIGCGGQCDDIQAAYPSALEAAKRCDPQQTGQCSKVIIEGLQCGCDTHVNPENVEAISAVQAAQQEFNALSCGGDVLCGACEPPSSGVCSAAGRCEDVWGGDGGAACKVNGVVYESGTSGIPDPVSCNTCTCNDGELGCTDLACPSACPPNSVYGTQCAECGPTDACLIVEHGCLPVCDGICMAGVCIDGICKTFCG